MTRTVNRQPAQVNLPSNNAIKDYYFDHYNWKGICDDKNFLEVDQETFSYSENVYVDSESRLRSRPAVKFESLPTGLVSSWNSKLVKAWTFNDVVFEQYTTTESNETKTRFVFRDKMPLTGVTNATFSVDYIKDNDNSPLISVPILVDNYIFVFTPTAIYRYSMINKSVYSSNSINANKNSIYIPNTKVISADNQETAVESKNVLTTYEIYTYLYNRTSGYSMDLLGKQVSIKIDGEEYTITFDVDTPIVTVDKINQWESNVASQYYVFVSKLNGVAILNKSNNMLYFSPNGGKVFDYLGVIPYVIHDLPKFSDDGYYITCVTQSSVNETAPNAVYIISALDDAVTLDDGTIVKQKRYPTFTRISDNWPDGIKGFSSRTFLTAHFYSYNLAVLFAKSSDTSSYVNSIIDETDENGKIYFISNGINLSSNTSIDFPTSYSYSEINGKCCDFYRKNSTYYITSAITLEQDNDVHMSGSAVVCRKISKNDMGDLHNNQYYQANMTSVYTSVEAHLISQMKFSCITMKHISENDNQYVLVNTLRGSNGIKENLCAFHEIDTTKIYSSYSVQYYYTVSSGINFPTAYKYPSYLSDDGTTQFAGGTAINKLTSTLRQSLINAKVNTYCGYTTNEPTKTNLNTVVQNNMGRGPINGDVVKVNYSTSQSLYTYTGNNIHPWVKTDYFYITAPCGFTDSIYYVVYVSDYEAVDPNNDSDGSDTKVNSLLLFSSNTDKTFEFKYTTDGSYYPFIPDCNNQLSEVYLSKGNFLYISEHKENDNGEFIWYLPEINKQTMNYPITALHPISNTEMAIFNEREVWYVYYDTNLNGYAYTKSKLHVGVQHGSDIVTTYDGTTVLFVCERGAVALAYQDFIAATEQKLTYISDTVYNLFKNWNVGPIKIYSYDFWIVFYKTTSKDCWVYDIRTNSWWYFKNFVNNEQLLTTVVLENGNRRYVPRIISGQSLYKLHLADTEYYDTDSNNGKHIIDWNLLSQKLYLKAVNYFKHITNIILNTAVDDLKPVIMNYKMDIINYRHDTNIGANNEVFTFSVDTIRTFVKRLNYMKVLEFQYALKTNNQVSFVNQRPLSLCSIDIRYKITGKVR